MRIRVTSPAFQDAGNVPRRYTCDGEDISPELHWDELPPETKSVALICDDPDAPGGDWVHWLLYSLPSQATMLPAGVPMRATLADGARHGKNDFRRLGYGGPCPPPGKPHRYFFRLYALDADLTLPAGASRDELLHAIKGHVLAEGQLMGRYGR
jgi:hypothetical protein